MQKLPKQGYIAPRLKSSLQKLYGRHHNLVDRYEISISQMTMELLLFEAGTTYPTGAPEFTPYFWLGPCCSFFNFFVLSYYVYVLSSML